MEQNYVIFTDTDGDMTPNLAKEYGYHIISMPYTLEDKEVFPYADGKEIDFDAFYAKLRKGAKPFTSALSPKSYEDYFEPFFKEGKDILYVHLSKAMSGTFNAMNIAVNNLKSRYPERKLYTIDTKGITLCELNIALEVGEQYKAGKSVDEILKWAETEVDKFATYFFVNDLTFFRRSGRVKFLAAFMGNIFGIRPIITMDANGVMTPVSKARGLNGAIDKVLEYVDELKENIYDHRVILAHSDSIKTVEEIKKRLKEKFGEKLNIMVVDVNPTAGCHCGPDGVGICFHAKHR